MAARPDEFLRVLEEKSADFRRTAHGRVAGMELLWSSIRGGSAAPDELMRLERTAHALAGSGAIFGYASLGDAARRLEQRLHGLIEAGAAPTPADDQAIGVFLATMREGL